ncbi:hypothetical protein C9I57_31855 [Trinickia symbiotica]|uniref:Uncharacterized protein n=1 Tax=Trinickia symbiotica TaxID=863227 RepID=A0A2T3XJP3_9BURK|nr:hypothetical protein C9I57_31855 [Trinickia symbiotica]
MRLAVVFTLGLELLFMAAVYVGAPFVIYLTGDGRGYHVIAWDQVQRLIILAPILGALLTIAALFTRKR